MNRNDGHRDGHRDGHNNKSMHNRKGEKEAGSVI